MASGSPPAAEKEPENKPTHCPANHPQVHEVVEASADEQEVPLQEVTNKQIGANFRCKHTTCSLQKAILPPCTSPCLSQTTETHSPQSPPYPQSTYPPPSQSTYLMMDHRSSLK